MQAQGVPLLLPQKFVFYSGVPLKQGTQTPVVRRAASVRRSDNSKIAMREAVTITTEMKGRIAQRQQQLGERKRTGQMSLAVLR